MPDQTKVAIYERNGVELDELEEMALKGSNIPFNHPDFSSDNLDDAIVEARENPVIKEKRVLVLSRNGSAGDVWLNPHNGINSNQTYWLAEKNYKLLGVKFSNKKNGSSSNPMVVRLTCYGQPASSSGNISSNDPSYWWIEAGNGSETVSGYRGRSWWYDSTIEEPNGNDGVEVGSVYGFRLQSISGTTPNDVWVEIHLEEI